MEKNFLSKPIKRGFVFQTSPFRNCDRIPTSSVSMRKDTNQVVSPQRFFASTSAEQPFLPLQPPTSWDCPRRTSIRLYNQLRLILVYSVPRQLV